MYNPFRKIEVTEYKEIKDIYNPSLFINITSVNKKLNLDLIYRSQRQTKKKNDLINKEIKLATKG